MAPSPRLVGAACLLLAAASALTARATTYDLGLSVGSALSVDAGDRFDGAFDDSWAELGLELSIGWEEWSLELAWLNGETTGFDTLTTSDGPSSGTVRFEYHRLDAGVARSFRLGDRWSAVAGLGPTVLAWREENPLVEHEETSVGGHLLLGFDRRAGSWIWRFALRYAQIPDAVAVWDGFDPVAYEDLGLASFAVSPRRALDGSPELPVGSRWSLRAQVLGVYPTDESRLILNRVASLEAEADSTAGLGIGGAAWLTGPLRLSWDVAYARPTLNDRLLYPNTDTTFRASGDIDLWMGVLGLDLRLYEGARTTLFLTPLVAYLKYEGTTSGEFSAIVDRDGFNAGLGLEAEVGRGRWAGRAALRHLGLARIEGFPSGFDLQPITLDVGAVYRFGGGR